MPIAAICISPLVDLKGYDPDCQHDIVSKRQVEALKRAYLSDHEDMNTWNEASPIQNNLSNLPPVLVQTGDKEVLYPQARADGTEISTRICRMCFRSLQNFYYRNLVWVLKRLGNLQHIISLRKDFRKRNLQHRDRNCAEMCRRWS